MRLRLIMRKLHFTLTITFYNHNCAMHCPANHNKENQKVQIAKLSKSRKHLPVCVYDLNLRCLNWGNIGDLISLKRLSYFFMTCCICQQLVCPYAQNQNHADNYELGNLLVMTFLIVVPVHEQINYTPEKHHS